MAILSAREQLKLEILVKVVTGLFYKTISR